MEERNYYPTNVIMLALSGVLFFSFIVQYTLKKNDYDGNKEERNFINGWCNVGNLLWILFILFLLCFLGAEKLTYGIFSILAKIFASIILIVLCISFPLIIAGKNFEIISTQQTKKQKLEILKLFIPIFSSYYWFSIKEYDRPFWRIKESQMWLTIIRLALFIFNSWIPCVVVIGLMGIRMLFLYFGKDIIPQEYKVKLNHLFRVYPEEIGAIVRLKLVSRIKKLPIDQATYKKYQDNYAIAWSRKTKIWTFGIIALTLMGCGYYWRKMSFWRKLIPITWILLRGSIIMKSGSQYPKIPILAEITINN